MKQMSVCRLVCFKKVTTNLGKDSVPYVILAKFFMVLLIDREKLHRTNILFWPQRLLEDVLGGSEDELRTPAFETSETEVVEVGLDVGDVVGRGINGVGIP